MPDNPLNALQKATSIGPDLDHPSKWSENELVNTITNFLIGQRDEPVGPADIMMAIPMVNPEHLLGLADRLIPAAGEKIAAEDAIRWRPRPHTPEIPSHGLTPEHFGLTPEDMQPHSFEPFSGSDQDLVKRVTQNMQTSDSHSGRFPDMEKILRIAKGEPPTRVLANNAKAEGKQAYNLAKSNLDSVFKGTGLEVPSAPGSPSKNFRSRMLPDDVLKQIRELAINKYGNMPVMEAASNIIRDLNLSTQKPANVRDIIRGNTFARPGMKVRP